MPHDDSPPQEHAVRNLGVILGIVGGVLLLALVGCGVGVWVVTQRANEALIREQARADAAEADHAAESAAEAFLDDLSNGRVQAAYDSTTPAFQAKHPRPQFDDLLTKHPLLTSHKDHQDLTSGMTGTKPTRQRRGQVSLSETPIGSGFDAAGNPVAKPKGPRPTVTVTVAEQPDGTWKVDQLTVP